MAATLGTAGVLTAVLIWAPAGMRGWLSGVLAAVVAGVGKEFVQNLIPALRAAIRPAATEPGDTETSPVSVTVSLSDASYFRVDDPAEGVVLVTASGHTVCITVEALTDRTVILTGMRPVVLARRPPSGSLAPHAGILPVRRFTLLLDEDPPVLRSEDHEGFPFTVAPHDPEMFEVRVDTERWDVTWMLELGWISAGREGTARIDLSGHPFRTMARPPGQSLDW